MANSAVKVAQTGESVASGVHLTGTSTLEFVGEVWVIVGPDLVLDDATLGVLGQNVLG
jgi:hypothetical protein